MSSPPGSERMLCCAGRTLTFERTRVMGVLNITPDSFSDGGLFLRNGRLCLDRVRRQAEVMIAAGADVLDVGGESTRPGAEPVAIAEELERVIPVVEALLELDTIVSVDTCKADVARAAIGAGAHMINDVTGLANPEMLALLAATNAGICIMHMQGEPRTMQNTPVYQDVLKDVRTMLSARVGRAREAGIAESRICLDPGFGFGKTLEHNLSLLAGLSSLRIKELPILVGLSRKQMIGTLTGEPVDARTSGSVAAALLAAERGADLVRVHDVPETVQALQVFEALRAVEQV